MSLKVGAKAQHSPDRAVREAWDDIRAKLMATNSQAEWDRVLNTAVEQGVWTGLGGRHGVDLYGPDVRRRKCRQSTGAKLTFLSGWPSV